MPNSIPEDGILSNKRRTERKSILQKSSAKLLQTNYQTLSYEKENIEVGQVRVPDFRMMTAVSFTQIFARSSLVLFILFINELELADGS